ncbi:DNA repair protein complementing XP-C cells homolog [Anopheles nili]|uniref:DNA repair protein complementing XP-C cells homolog n=1 Tax=Anopheles nili TaxID=185578 RepID=UPI00237A3E2A|nr:DNA repair protein complementing XP-C cells homolog [Anopheles nili]
MESNSVQEETDNDQDDSFASSVQDFSASEDDWTPEKGEQLKSAVKGVKRKRTTEPIKKTFVLAGPARISRRIAAKKGIILPEDPPGHDPVQLLCPGANTSGENSESEDEKTSTKKVKRKVSRPKLKRARKKSATDKEPIKLTTFTVEQLYRKYRPDLAPLVTPSAEKPSTSKQHAVGRKKRNPSDRVDAGDDSESSGDDYLVDPSELDLDSEFFRPSEKETEQREAVDLYFDCNAGVELTDSDEEDTRGEQSVLESKAAKIAPASAVKTLEHSDAQLGKKLIQQINQSSEAYVHMVRLAEAAHSLVSKENGSIAGTSKGSPQNTALESRKQEDIDSLLVTGEKLPNRGKNSLSTGFGRNDFVTVVPTKPLELADGCKDIEITLKLVPEVAGKSGARKRTFDVLTALKRFMNREKRTSQQNMHKVSLLCWIGHGTYVNNVLRKPSLIRLAQKKLLPGVRDQTSASSRPNGLTNLRYFQEITRYFRRTITLKDDTMFYRQRQHPALDKFLIFAIAKKAAYCQRDYILLFVLMLRTLGVYCRLVISPPVPPKHIPTDQLYKMNPRTGPEMAMERQLLQDFRLAPPNSMVYVAKQKLRSLIAKQKNASVAKGKRRAPGFSIPQLDGGADEPAKPQQKRNLKLLPGSFLRVASNQSKDVRVPLGSAQSASREDDQHPHVDEVQRRRERILAAYRARAAKLASKKDKQLASGRNGCDVKKGKGKTGVDYWVEVFCEHEDKWITIDVLNGSVYKLEDIVKQATQPIVYVLAWNNDGSIKDVSPRYISRLGSKKSKLRVDDPWLEKALRPYHGKRNKRDLIEDVKFDRLLNKRPFPEQISEFKNHPKYAIERYLLRNEAIYPPDAPILGHIREEPIYLRDCVHQLHSREAWLRQAKTVRLHEAPYKVVKAKAKYDRFTGAAITGQTVELFGEWQVKDYEPPVAKDGLVPRSAYGNVDLFQPCMLPKGTVHLQLPGLNRICRRLRIDCAQAITGFEYRNSGCQAVYDGFVVCAEFRDQVLDEWYQEQVELQRKEDERRQKRIYANWRRLIMGLSIRKKLKDRYNFDNM